MLTCVICGKSAEGLHQVLLNCDGDFACSEACARKHEADKKKFFASIGNDEAYARWWAADGVDVKAMGDEAWKSK